MKGLTTFTNTKFTVLAKKDLDIIMFDAETVAKSLGLTTVAKSGNACVRWSRVNNYLKLSGESQLAKGSLITEQQAYKLAFKANNLLAEQFQDWLAEDVIPSIRKTGKYEMPKVETKPYEYFDKTYNGEPVLTTNDVEHLTKIKRNTIDWYLRTKLAKDKDYYFVEGDCLRKYKAENPKISKLASAAYLITREGFIKLCRAYGVVIETPKCFEEKTDIEPFFSINKLMEKLNNKYGYDISVRDLTQELADIYTDGKIKNQSVTIKNDNKYYICVDRSAPLLNRRFLAAQGIGCILSGQLTTERDKGATTLIANYSDTSISFASSLMALSIFFDK